MKKLNDIILLIEKYVGATIFAIIFLIVTSNMVMRYIFSNSFFWTEEASKYLFVWMIFLSSAYAVGRDKHIKISLFLNLFSNKTVVRIKILCYIIFIGIIGYSIPSIIDSFSHLRLSPVLRIPLEYIYFIMPISFILFLLHAVYRIIFLIKQEKTNNG